jgi:hypothetical protein
MRESRERIQVSKRAAMVEEQASHYLKQDVYAQGAGQYV